MDRCPAKVAIDVQFPAHPGQIGQTQMPGGVGGEPRHVRGQRDPAHHLRPGPQGQRLGAVAPRLRQEQRAPGPAERAAVAQVAPQQHPGRGGVGHDPFPAGLGRLRPDPQRAVRGIDIVGAQRAQFLAAQRRVVGQRQHQPVADRLAAEHLQQPCPFALGRDPRQLDHPRHQRPGAAAELPTRGVAAAADRVGISQALLDEEVVEQPHRHQTLLQRGVGQADPGVQSDDVGTAVRSGRQLPHEQRDLRTIGGQRVDAVTFTDQQILRQPPRIRVDGAPGTTQIGPDAQPLGGTFVPTQDGPLLLHVHARHGLSLRGSGDDR